MFNCGNSYINVMNKSLEEGFRIIQDGLLELRASTSKKMQSLQVQEAPDPFKTELITELMSVILEIDNFMTAFSEFRQVFGEMEEALAGLGIFS